MCIIICNKPSYEIEKSHIITSFDNNSASAGFMYVENGEIKYYKKVAGNSRTATAQEREEFHAEYVRIRTLLPESWIVLHFRIPTGGHTDLNNCHPFKISENLGFCHNGMISIPTVNNNYCDTVHFNETILKPLAYGNHIMQASTSQYCRLDRFSNLGKEYPFDEEFKAELGRMVGGVNKLAFLSSDNKVSIINESSSIVNIDGNWYSNSTYKAYHYDRGGVSSVTSWNNYDDYYDRYDPHRTSNIRISSPEKKAKKKLDVFKLDTAEYYMAEMQDVREVCGFSLDTYKLMMKDLATPIITRKEYESREDMLLTYEQYLETKISLINTRMKISFLDEDLFEVWKNASYEPKFTTYEDYVKNFVQKKNVFTKDITIPLEVFKKIYPGKNVSEYHKYANTKGEDKREITKKEMVMDKFNLRQHLSADDFSILRRITSDEYYGYIKEITEGREFHNISTFKDVKDYNKKSEQLRKKKSQITPEGEKNIDIAKKILEKNRYNINSIKKLAGLYAFYMDIDGIKELLESYPPANQGNYNIGKEIYDEAVSVVGKINSLNNVWLSYIEETMKNDHIVL